MSSPVAFVPGATQLLIPPAGGSGGKEAGPDTPSAEYLAMTLRWQLPEDLLGGTVRMRQQSMAGTTYGMGGRYLSPQQQEEIEDFKRRVASSFLFPGYEEALLTLSGRPFQRHTVFGKDTDKTITDWVEDIDLAGRDLSQFSHDFLEMAIHRGLAHVLPEFQNTLPADGGQRTLADDQRDGVRPYLCLIDPINVLGWRMKRINGVNRVIQLRIKECTSEPAGEYGEEYVERIRVYEDTGDGVKWTLYRLSSEGESLEEEDGGNYSLDHIALTTLYTRRQKDMVALPALLRLAELNLLHWQSQSDHRELFRFARAGILFGAGFEEDEITGKPAIGNTMWRVKNPQANLQWVEHEGQAIAASRQDLEDLKADMMTLSLRPLLTSRTGAMSATAVAIDTSQANSSLLSWVRRCEQAMETSLQSAAQFVKINDAHCEVDISDDVGIDPTQAADLATLLRLRAMGEIDSERLLSELRSRGFFSDSFVPEVEAEKARQQDPMQNATNPGMAKGIPRGPAAAMDGGIPGGGAV